MKKSIIELALSTMGVVAILIIGLLTVECTISAPSGGNEDETVVGGLIPTCKSRNIIGEFDTHQYLKLTRDLLAGETFDNSFSVDLGDEFRARYSVSLDSLKQFFVTRASLHFIDDRCKDLESYEVSITFPQLGEVNEKDRCDFPEFNNNTDATGIGNRIIYFSETFPGDSQVAQKALKTNFAEDFKNGGKIEVKFSCKARNPLPKGFGVVLALKSNLTYSVCD